MSQARLVGVKAPDELRALLLTIIESNDPNEGDEDPLTLTARIRRVPAPALWGGDAQLWIRGEIARLADVGVFEALETALDGNHRWDEPITSVLRRNDVGIECLDGAFFDVDQAADDYDLRDAEEEATKLLTGRYDHVGVQWSNALHAMRSQNPELALSLAVTAMEGAVKTATGAKDLPKGLLKLFPGPDRETLRKSIQLLYSFGSVVPNARHGAARRSDLDRIEARGTVRAAAVWIVTVINLERTGKL